MNNESQETLDLLKSKIDSEGFHGCFVDYSNWQEIKDAKFHELRRRYADAAKELEHYLEKYDLLDY